MLDSLTQAEEKALREYTGMGYDPMNGILRGHRPTLMSYSKHRLEEFTEHIDNLQKAIASRKSDRGMTLLRGVRNWDNSVAQTSGVSDFSSLKAGDFFSDLGFTSTTTDLRIAKDFSNGPAGWLMVVKVPPGTGMLHGTSRESELILNSGVKQKIKAVDPFQQIIYVEVLT